MQEGVGAVFQRNITENKLKLGNFLKIINPFVCVWAGAGERAIVHLFIAINALLSFEIKDDLSQGYNLGHECQSE